MRCAKCGTVNAGNIRFCDQCATPLNRSCPKCAYENAPEAKFCGQCAAPLQADNVASESPLTVTQFRIANLFIFTAVPVAAIYYVSDKPRGKRNAPPISRAV